MSKLIDDVARLLASPVPRRKTFKLLGGVLAAGLLGATGRSWAQAKAKGKEDDRIPCGADFCKKDEVCCRGVECCKKKEICCPEGPVFCATGKKKTCVSSPGPT